MCVYIVRRIKQKSSLSRDLNLNTFLMPFSADKNDHDPKCAKKRKKNKIMYQKSVIDIKSQHINTCIAGADEWYKWKISDANV